ncbi:MAG: ubiquitin-like small modifier protein 1 [Halobacteriota archaeon]
MRVDCRFFGPFREDTDEKRIELRTDATTYGELLETIANRYPELDGKLVFEGELVGEVVVTKNGRNIRHLDGLETRVESGDVVRMIPSVYGG